MCFCTLLIIIFWEIHFLSVSVVKFGGEGFNIPGTSFLTYKNGPFLRTKGMELVNGSSSYPFYIIFILHFKSDRTIIMLFK